MASSTVPIEMCDQVSSATINSATRLKNEVDERKAALFQRKDVFGNIDLAQQRAVLQHALHGHGRALAEEVEHQLADDKEQRKVLDALTALVEQRTEHGPHDQAGQQRVQHAPRHAQHAAAVFQLEITGNEVLQQVTVFPEACEGVFQFLHGLPSIFLKYSNFWAATGCAPCPWRWSCARSRSRATAR